MGSHQCQVAFLYFFLRYAKMRRNFFYQIGSIFVKNFSIRKKADSWSFFFNVFFLPKRQKNLCRDLSTIEYTQNALMYDIFNDIGLQLLAFGLRILAMYEAKTAKNSNFWMFWSITLLICRILKRWFISWIRGQKLQILPFFASYIASIVNISKTK